jgi:hypothetical protein
MRFLLAATAVVAVLAMPAAAQDTKYDPSRGDTVQKPSIPVAPGVGVVRPRTSVTGDDKDNRSSDRDSGTTGATGSTSGTGGSSDGGSGSGGGSGGGGSGGGGSGK